MTGLQLYAFVILPLIVMGVGLLAMVLHGRASRSEDRPKG
jgi:hypothetical protein